MQNENEKPAARKGALYTGIFLLIIVAVIAGFGKFRQSNSGDERRVIRTPADVTDFLVTFAEGSAILSWVDSTDTYLDHIEVSWEPGGTVPRNIRPGTQQFTLSGLKDQTEYSFKVTAVDKWGNTSDGSAGGTGRAFMNRDSSVASSAEITGVAGTPVEGKLTLGWTNLHDSEYDHIIVNYHPLSEAENGASGKTIRLGKGTGSAVITDLVNDTEYLFYVTAIDAGGNRRPLVSEITAVKGKPSARDIEADLERRGATGTPEAGELTVAWIVPDNIEYTHITIQYGVASELVSGSPAQTLRIPAAAVSRTITNLVNDIEYVFYVTAIDSQRRSIPLDEAIIGIRKNAPVSTLQAASPEIPGLKGTPTARTAVLSWSNPDYSGFDRIEINYGAVRETESGVSVKTITVPRGVNSKTITDLVNGFEYIFYITAVNSFDRHRPVKEMGLFIPDYAASQETVAGRSSSGEITVVWKYTGDPDLDHFEIIFGTSAGESMVVVDKSQSSKTFSGLSDIEDYIFTVYAADNTGHRTALKNVELLSQSVPTIAGKGTDKIVVKGMPVDGQITLDWNDPPAMEELDHIAIVYEPGGMAAPELVPRGEETKTFFGLEDSTIYTFLVYGVDARKNNRVITNVNLITPLRITPVEAIPDPPPAIAGEPAEENGTAANEAPPEEYELPALGWKSVEDSVFGGSTIKALSYGVSANGEGRWVAGGTEGKLAYSADGGVTWKLISDSIFGSSSIDAVKYDNGRWIAGGSNGRMAWSDNAILWNSIKAASPASAYNIHSIAFGGGVWLAGCSDGIILRSEDGGVNWDIVTAEAFGKSGINAIAHNDSRWIAGGTGGSILYSDDKGQTWNAIANNSFGDSVVNVVIYNQQRWIVGGYGRRLLWSRDGEEWQNLARPFYILCMNSNGSRWVAGGQEGRMAWSGDGGERWVVDEQARRLYGESWVQAIAFGKDADGAGRWISGGQNGKIIYADESVTN